MADCIACGKKAVKGTDHFFHVLQVRTLPVRDLDREKKVQMLGGFEDYCVCKACTEERLERDLNVVRAAGKKTILFFLVLCAGILLETANQLWLGGNMVWLTLGLAAIACGILGMIATVSDGIKRSKELKGMQMKNALREAALAVMRDHAPKKDKDVNLTYIPVDAVTMNRKNGDLMVLYNLIPDIAVQAYDRIHKEYHDPQQKK